MIQDKIKKILKTENSTWAKWADVFGKEGSNFRKEFFYNFSKLNKYLNALGFELWIKRKKRK